MQVLNFFFPFLLLTIACSSGNSQTGNEFSKIIEKFTQNKETSESMINLLNDLYKSDLSQIKNEKLLFIKVKKSQNTIINKLIVDINNQSFVSENYNQLLNDLNTNMRSFENSAYNKVNQRGVKVAWLALLEIGVTVAIAIYDYVNDAEIQRRKEMVRMLETVKIQ